MLADPTAPLMLEMRKRIGALKGKGVDILEACEKIIDGERALEKVRPTARRFSDIEEACVDWIIQKASLPGEELVSYLTAAEGPSSKDDGSSSDSSDDDGEANKAQKAAPSENVHRESSGGVRQRGSKTTSKTTTSRLAKKVNKYAQHLGLVAITAVSEK